MKAGVTIHRLPFRQFATATPLRASKSAQFKTHVKLDNDQADRSSRTFERNFPSREGLKKKPWDSSGVSKDEFFMRKYGQLSDDQKKDLREKMDRQKRMREQRINRETNQYRQVPRSFRANDGGNDRAGGRNDRSYERNDRDYERNDRASGRNDRDYERNDRSGGRSDRYYERNEQEQNQYETRRSSGSGGAASNGGHFLLEYVYGTHPVLAALTANKRDGFNRLIASQSVKESSDPKHLQIKKLCKTHGIKTVYDYPKQSLDRLSDRGVHNGVILETKPFVPPSVDSLPRVSDNDAASAQYQLSIYNPLYGTTVTVKEKVARKREPETKPLFPLGLYLDGITDPQNAGAIIRSAYYLGVDFIVVPEHDTARLGAACNKASGGSLELMSIYRTDSALPFIDEAKVNGWGVISADAKPRDDQLSDLKSKHRGQLASKYINATEMGNLLEKMPVLLVLGSEGAGVRTNMKFRSDFLVGLDKGRIEVRSGVDEIVDSLNVSVAAALLIEKCLQG